MMRTASWIAWIATAFGVTLAGRAAAGEAGRVELQYAPAPVDNPLKGLVPYTWADAAASLHAQFPHSMEFNYVPLAALVTGYDQYDWTPLENLLNAAAGRGHQAVFRVYMDWPGRKNLIPAFLLKDGLKVYTYLNANMQPAPPAAAETPDYSNANLRRVMKQFIAAVGKKYDGDPRIGFITAGLLGTWGEWHNYPRDDLFASEDVQIEVMDAYEAAFKTTPILLRYPSGETHLLSARQAPNASRRFGYHDDSFAWATLDTGKPADSWFFLALMKAAGPKAMDKWKTQPIGGEIRPEAWGTVFDANHGVKEIQDFRQCVEATHVSWLLDSGMFKKEKTPNAERVERAKEQARRMGYEFHVPAVAISSQANETLEVAVEIENHGVAPFYYDWPVEFGLLDANGHPIKTFSGSGKITGLLPGDRPRVWHEKLAAQGVRPGDYLLAMRIANPLAKGNPVRFANRTQDQHAPGWLTLAPVAWK